MHSQVDVGGETVSLDVPAGSPSFVRAVGTGVVLTIGAQRISGDFAFENDGTTTTVNLTNVSMLFAAGGTTIATLSSGHAAFVVDATGAAGTVHGTVRLTFPGVDLGGTIELKVNTTTGSKSVDGVTVDPGFTFTGTGITLSLGDVDLSVGTLRISQTTDSTTHLKTTTVNLANAVLALAGIGDVTVNGDLVVGPGGVAGQLSVAASLSLGSAATLSGTIVLALNSGTQAVDLTTSSGIVRLPAGRYLRVAGEGLDLTVGGSNGLVIHGSFVVEQATSSTGQTRTVLGVAGASVSLGGTAILDHVTGALVLRPDDPATTVNEGGLAARVGGSLNLTGLLPANVQVSGDFEVSINQTGVLVDEGVTVGSGADAETVTLDLPIGPYVRIAATNVTLSIAGQSLTGDVAFEQQTVNSATATVITVDHLALSLGGGVVTVSDGTGRFVLGGTPTARTMTGHVAANVHLHVPGDAVALGGHFFIDVNTATSSLTVGGTGVYVEVAGQRIAGDFTLTQTGTGPARVVTVTIANLDAFFGAPGPDEADPATGGHGLHLTTTSGSTSTIVLTSAGVVADVSANVAIVGLPSGITFGGTSSGIPVHLQLNTGTAPATVAGVVLPAGLVRLELGPVDLSLGGFLVLRGVFSIEKAPTAGPDHRLGTTDDGAGLKIAVTQASLFVGDQGGSTYVPGTSLETVKDNDTGLWLTNGTALLLLGGDAATGGFAGHISAGAALYLGHGVAASVDEVSLDINQRAGAVNEDFVVGGETKTLVLPAGPYLDVAVTGMRITIGGFRATADVEFRKNAAGTTVSLTNLSIGIGPDTHPVVLVSNGHGSLVIPTGGGIVLSLTVDLAIDVPGVTLSSGTFHLGLNTAAQTVEVSASNVVLVVAGQRLTGSFTVVKTGTTITLNPDLTLELGNGTETFLSLHVSGPVLITPQGVALDVDANVALGSGLASRLGDKLILGTVDDPGITVHIKLNTGTAAINRTLSDGTVFNVPAGTQGAPYVLIQGGSVDPDGTTVHPVVLTVMGQQLSGVFSFEQVTSTTNARVVRIGFSHVGLFLGTPGSDAAHPATGGTGLVVSNGSGAILVTAGGVAGTFGADLALVGLSGALGASLSTHVDVSVNTILAPVDLTIGGVRLNLPRGSFFRAAVTGFTLSFGDAVDGHPGYQIVGNFLFQKATQGGADVLTVAMSGVQLNKWSHDDQQYAAVGISNIEGLLLVNPNGQAGYALTLSADVTASGNGFTAGGRVGFVVNTSTADLSGTHAVDVDVNGTVVHLDIAPRNTDGSPRVKLTLSDAAFDFGGVLEIRGNFSIDDSGNFTGTGLTVFVGKGPSTDPHAIGVLITNAAVDFHRFGSANTDPYALRVTGTVALVGLDGLRVSGDVAFAVNTGSTSQPWTSTATQSTACPMSGTVAGQTFSLTVCHLHLGVAGVLDIAGTLQVTREPNGTLDLAMGNASVLVKMGSVGIRLQGYAAFSISPTTGFRLSGFKVRGFDLLTSAPDFTTNAADTTSTVPTLFPSADLASPFNGAMVAAAPTSIQVTFNDVNGVGLNPLSITDVAPEFEVWVNGTQQSVTIGAPTPVGGKVNTYSYTISGLSALPTSVVEIRFLQGAFSDSNGNASMAETERFFVVTMTSDGQGHQVPVPPGPTAALASPTNGTTLSATELNQRRYIDVTYTSLDGNPISRASIEDAAAEFTLTGTGVLDLMRDSSNAPVLVGIPLLISGLGPAATTRTYRYYFKDRNTANTIDLFGPGTITVSFLGWTGTPPNQVPAWASVPAGTDPSVAYVGTSASPTGWNLPNLTQTFTLNPAAAGAATASGQRGLGPLTIDGPSVGITDVGFSDGMLVLTIALGANHAGLAFGGGQQPDGSTKPASATVDLIGLQGTFDLAVDAFGLLGGHVRIEPTGKWSIRIASMEAEVPNLVRLTAEGVTFGYDPGHDPATGHQELLRIASAAITFPSLGVTGSIRPYDPTAGRSVAAPTDGSPLPSGQIPGLVVWDNGFQLGTAELAYGLPPYPPGQTPPAGNQLTSTQSATDRDINLFGILKLDDLRVGVQGLKVITSGGSTTFDGSIYIATGGATLFPGKAFSATITDRTTADDVNSDGTQNTEALHAALTFSGGQIDSFQLQVDTLSIRLGQFATLSAVGVNLNTGATGSETLIEFTSVGATVRIGSVVLTGEARKFAFLADGTFVTRSGFGIFIAVGSATGDSFKWPSFLPVRIDSIGVTWVDVQHHPEDFELILSASVTGIKGVSGLTFSGSIQGVHIKPSLLAQGQFPITQVDSLGVTVSGKMFGGEIEAGLVGGIMRLNASYQEIGPFDTTTPVIKRVFYLGLQGSFKMAGIGGFGIRVGLSELGPLSVFLNVQLPTGIVIVPQVGLTINDFVAGVEFFKTLPSVDDPFALRNTAFSLPTNLTADQWLISLKQQVATQAQTVSLHPEMSGFEAAFTSPMTITGSARIYSLYTSQAVFNGRVTVMISTDGKFLVHGQLNFADNNLSISGRLYADLSRISNGNVVILFLADIPDQVKVLTIYGKIKMGFKDATGQEVTFTVPDEGATGGAPVPPTGDLSVPVKQPDGSTSTVGNGGHVDATVLATLLNSSDTHHYLDVIYQAAPGATIDWLTLRHGAGRPFTLTTGGNGSTVGGTWTYTGASTAAGTPLVTVTTDTGLQFVPIQVKTWTVHNPDGSTSSVHGAGYTVDGVDRILLKDADVPAGCVTSTYTLDECLMAAAIRLSGANRLRYDLGTGAIKLGVVNLHFNQDAFRNMGSGTATGLGNAPFDLSFTVTGTTVQVVDPGNGGGVDVNVLNNRDWIDVVYHLPSGSFTLVRSSITDLEAEFTLTGPGLGSIVLDSARAPLDLCDTAHGTVGTADSRCGTGTAVYRYWLSGQWAPSGDVTLRFLPDTWSYQFSQGLPTTSVTLDHLAAGQRHPRRAPDPPGRCDRLDAGRRLAGRAARPARRRLDRRPRGLRPQRDRHLPPAGRRAPAVPRRRLGDHPGERRRDRLRPGDRHALPPRDGRQGRVLDLHHRPDDGDHHGVVHAQRHRDQHHRHRDRRPGHRTGRRDRRRRHGDDHPEPHPDR